LTIPVQKSLKEENKMKCFVHPHNDAVAQCSQCQKGTCPVCACTVAGATLCSSCYRTELNAEIARARRSIVGVWIFTGIITALTALTAFGSLAQSGALSLLLIPLAFAASWCLFWGGSPVWNGFRNAFAGWGCFGTWYIVLAVALLISSILVGIALVVGAFTGIQKYISARRLLATGNQAIAALSGSPMPTGLQGGQSV
jgi:hypothetical protein